MTRQQRTQAAAKGSVPLEDFLSLPWRERTARLLGVPKLPNYGGASIAPGGYIEWSPPSPGSAPLKMPPNDLCFQFARLAEGSEEEIQRFAATWGPLGGEFGINQRVDEWRIYARTALAILRFAADKSSEGRGRDDDWTTICQWIHPTLVNTKRKKGMRKRDEMAFVTAAINTWYRTAKDNAIAILVGDRPQIRPHGSNLFGILGVQIAHVVARSDQNALCAGCDTPFKRIRPISRGSRQYCRACRKMKIPERDAARDYRQRSRLKKLAK